MTEDSVSLNRPVISHDGRVKASEGASIVHYTPGDAPDQQSPGHEYRPSSPADPPEDLPGFEELERLVDAENHRLKEKQIPVSLRLHRHIGEIYLQVVDRRISDQEKVRRFRVLDREGIRRITMGLFEELGICLDTSA